MLGPDCSDPAACASATGRRGQSSQDVDSVDCGGFFSALPHKVKTCKFGISSAPMKAADARASICRTRAHVPHGHGGVALHRPPRAIAGARAAESRPGDLPRTCRGTSSDSSSGGTGEEIKGRPYKHLSVQHHYNLSSNFYCPHKHTLGSHEYFAK